MFLKFHDYEGLSQNSVVSIAQDSLGFMWFATQDKLNRFSEAGSLIDLWDL